MMGLPYYSKTSRNLQNNLQLFARASHGIFIYILSNKYILPVYINIIFEFRIANFISG